MDQNTKHDSKWPTLKACTKVDILRRIRDNSRLNSSGRDNFVRNIQNEGLEKEWGRQMSESNPYDR